MGWKEYLEQNCANYKNFVLLGEAGSGKSGTGTRRAAGEQCAGTRAGA